ncbi:chemotaxis protein [Helicobacter monodelphidis]|uniref:chemotaxis protein n=1 Tax=Helicobacter sp. 15-1451 TaxID=2004995 RepID=UPI000DCF0FA1|nr:chemotaxis protein [Helicobacter sp. 15-1451]RAX58577.1 chemotaxis protein [Helicobacter sp. 15-1451]
MTQEELDSLMNGDVSLDGVLDETTDTADAEEEGMVVNTADAEGYRVAASNQWPPPPPTEDHKVVSQLDDVTKGIETKANQVFDYLETISNQMMDIEGNGRDIQKFVKTQKELFEKLHEAFPQIQTFSKALADIENAQKKVDLIITSSLDVGDGIMSIMDTMQYQDIHRQKIERVINVMRTLSKYMNSLFEGKIDDSKRVASATHIAGDKDTKDVVSEDDIEALIASLGGGHS